MRKSSAAIVALASGAALSTVGCAGGTSPEKAIASITAEDIARDDQVLASDSFGGRAPSSRGEELTINYLKGRFQDMGLQPGNGDSYFQEVPLVSIMLDPNTGLRIAGGGGTTTFEYGSEYMAWTKRVVESVELSGSEMVFVGYGVVAPEYDWNDYAGVDVKGKTVVMLVNDPGFASGDTTLFNGKSMTYYGRWTYKYEEAARQGAAAALIVHETEPAGYPWEVVEGSWKGEQFDLESENGNMNRAKVEGWLTLESARKVFDQAGLDYDTLKAAAAKRGFEAVPMGLKASSTLHNTLRHSTSHNVLAVLPGRDRPDEYVVYTAHWDHLGTKSGTAGDSIYNGALDNASGVAGLLALAGAFSSLSAPPQRSILFMSVTAEEQGLLGSKYYATHPVYPLNKTVAEINMDGLDIWGPMKDITVIGYGQSKLDDYLAQAAQTQDRHLRPDPEPEKGFYYRSDHFEFAKQGVPALYTDAGIESVEHGEEWARQQRDAYTAERYHKPADEYDPDWDLRGAVEDLQLLFRVGYRLVNESTFPNWKPGSEFKAKRDSMMRGAS